MLEEEKEEKSLALNTFPKEYRVSGKKRIKSIFVEGTSFYLNGFKIVFRKTDIGYNSFLLCITKKAGNAKVRNTIRRRLRDAIRTSNIKKSSSFDIALISSNKKHFHENKQFFIDFIHKLITRLIL